MKEKNKFLFEYGVTCLLIWLCIALIPLEDTDIVTRMIIGGSLGFIFSLVVQKTMNGYHRWMSRKSGKENKYDKNEKS